MSTSAISSSSLNQQLQQYFQTRRSDLQQLGQALQSGNLSSAQSAFNNITSLGQSGPFSNGAPFASSSREQDFTAVGQALQNGDLAGAQQAFSQLETSFNGGQPQSASNANSSPGPEIVLNLTPQSGGTPEEITLEINTTGTGGQQVSLTLNQDSGSGSGSGSPPPPITANPLSGSGEQIVINLLGAATGESGGTSNGSATGSGISISA